MKNNKKSGVTVVEILVVAGIVAIICAFCFKFFTKHIWGNKQIIDFNHQNFTVAYVLSDNDAWQKMKIKAWKDWENSDSIQIVTTDGKAIYTHLRNVKLVEE